MALAASSRRWKLMKAKPYETEQRPTSTHTHTPRFSDWKTKINFFFFFKGGVGVGVDLGLPGVLVLSQVDPGDGPEGPEELLQVGLPGVLGQVGDADGGVVVRCSGR